MGAFTARALAVFDENSRRMVDELRGVEEGNKQGSGARYSATAATNTKIRVRLKIALRILGV